MALTLEQLQSQRDRLLSEMSEPQEIWFKNRKETKRPQPELEAALRRIDAEIARMRSPQARQFTLQTKRGLE